MVGADFIHFVSVNVFLKKKICCFDLQLDEDVEMGCY